MEQKQKLNPFDFTMVVVGLVIGMGIFRTAATSAKHAIDPSVFFAAWIAGGLIALCGALTYAEIGSRYPVTGGYYKIFARVYHPSIAFAINCIILVSNAASLAGVALIGAGYISHVFMEGPPQEYVKMLVSIVSILIFYGVNLAGLRMSAKAQSALMVIKVGMVLLLISALFLPASIVPNTPSIGFSLPGDGDGWRGWIHSFGLSLIAVSFTYGGYQQTINFGNEVDKPRRNMPRGIFAGIALIIVLYLLVNLSYFRIIGFSDLKNQEEIAGAVAGLMFGPRGALIFSGFLFLSVLAYVNVSLMSNPRVMFAMSQDGALPGIFAKQNGKKGVYLISLTSFAAISLVILFFAGTFDKILNFVIFLDSIGMAASAATIFAIRRRTRHLDGTGIYSMKLFPLIPLVFIVAYIFIAGSVAMQTPETALIGTAVLAGFTILYFATQKLRPKGIEEVSLEQSTFSGEAD